MRASDNTKPIEEFGAVPSEGTKGSVAEVTVICGFLGSGKTTLLKRLLDWELERGANPQVVMSEFGDLDIDGVLLQEKPIPVARITGGCACCDLREELAGCVKQAACAAQGSRIYIEATGVADPAGILEALLPVLTDGEVSIRKVIVVYDASRHQSLGKDRDLAQRQVRTANLILLNKCDLVSPQQAKAIAADLARINPSATVISTVNCDLEPAEILKRENVLIPSGGTEGTSGDYRSFAFLIDDPLSRPALERWLRALPSSVVRVKGFVRIEGEGGLFEVQAVQGQSSVLRLDAERNIQPVIVVIAHPMRTDGLVRGLERCVVA